MSIFSALYNRFDLPRITPWIVAVVGVLMGASAHAAPNPVLEYVVDGAPVARSWILGDPGDWSRALEGQAGQSAGGKVKVQPAVHDDGSPALRVEFTRKKVNGQLGLYGAPIDLRAARDQVVLTIEMRMLTKPRGSVYVAMDCEYPCRAQLPIHKALKDYPMNEWFLMPIPLNCFQSDNFDLSKINAPFVLMTTGRVTLEIGDIKLARLPDSMQSCAAPT